MSPLALAVRAFKRWRRGSQVRIGSTWAEFPSDSPEQLCRLDLELDVPGPAGGAFRARLTDAVVRIAEALRRPDDVYHTVYRQPELEETVLLALGPQLQELGERLALTLAQAALAGRTVVWLTLPRDRTVSEVIDPLGYDPEADGEPDRLMSEAGMRWGMATSYVTTVASTAYRVLLYLPQSAIRTVEQMVQRLQQ
jgi:hypothetical protein